MGVGVWGLGFGRLAGWRVGDWNWDRLGSGEK